MRPTYSSRVRIMLLQINNPDRTLSTRGNPFPVENRVAMGEVQDLGSLLARLNSSGLSFLEAVSDFHLLYYLATDDVLAFLRVSANE